MLILQYKYYTVKVAVTNPQISSIISFYKYTGKEISNITAYFTVYYYWVYGIIPAAAFPYRKINNCFLQCVGKKP